MSAQLERPFREQFCVGDARLRLREKKTALQAKEFRHMNGEELSMFPAVPQSARHTHPRKSRPLFLSSFHGSRVVAMDQ
jgi:hypothetical protein